MLRVVTVVDTLFVSFFVSKNWIGNERKRRGMASKRGPREADGV